MAAKGVLAGKGERRGQNRGVAFLLGSLIDNNGSSYRADREYRILSLLFIRKRLLFRWSLFFSGMKLFMLFLVIIECYIF